jgi:hypothetical protein
MPSEIGASDGVAFLVSAAFAADIVAKACSSPQTMEINASARAGTLMKWVMVGLVEAAFVVGIAATFDKKHRTAIIAGGLVEGVITYFEYVHAKQAGLASSAPGTETY